MKGTTMSDEPVFDKTLAEADLPSEVKQEIQDLKPTFTPPSTLSFSMGAVSPPSHTLDTEPSQKTETPADQPDEPQTETVDEADHDDEDVKAALERDTQDGVGETDPSELPESDLDESEDDEEPSE